MNVSGRACDASAGRRKHSGQVEAAGTAPPRFEKNKKKIKIKIPASASIFPPLLRRPRPTGWPGFHPVLRSSSIHHSTIHPPTVHFIGGSSALSSSVFPAWFALSAASLKVITRTHLLGPIKGEALGEQDEVRRICRPPALSNTHTKKYINACKHTHTRACGRKTRLPCDLSRKCAIRAEPPPKAAP